MNIDQDTCEWLGCPTPLEMYKHQCALLEDEISDLQRHLAKARANVAGLVQMNDTLLIAKARAERSLRDAQDRLSGTTQDQPEIGSFRPIDLVTEQRDQLHRENQRLLLELSVLRGLRP
jgi:cell division septum initiation protein DivIVA